MNREINALLSESAIKVLHSLAGKRLEAIHVSHPESPYDQEAGRGCWAGAAILRMHDKQDVLLYNRDFWVKEEINEHPSLQIVPLSALTDDRERRLAEDRLLLSDVLSTSSATGVIAKITVLRDTITTNPWDEEEAARGEESIRVHTVDIAVRFQLDNGQELLAFCMDSLAEWVDVWYGPSADWALRPENIEDAHPYGPDISTTYKRSEWTL